MTTDDLKTLRYNITFVPFSDDGIPDLSKPHQVARIELLAPNGTPTGNRYLISYDLNEPCGGSSSSYKFLSKDNEAMTLAWNTLLGYLECEARRLHGSTFLPSTPTRL